VLRWEGPVVHGTLVPGPPGEAVRGARRAARHREPDVRWTGSRKPSWPAP